MVSGSLVPPVVTVGGELPCGFWDANSSALEDSQYTLEPTLHALFMFPVYLVCSTVNQCSAEVFYTGGCYAQIIYKRGVS